MTATISDEHVEAVCKIGQREATCAYLLMSPGEGFICAKGSSVEATIRAKLAAGTIGAQGDNCPGWGL